MDSSGQTDSALRGHVIERGYPFKGQRFTIKAAVRRLKIGDSILVRGYLPPAQKRRRPNARPQPNHEVRAAFRMNDFSLCYSHEGEPEGMVRVWRTA